MEIQKEKMVVLNADDKAVSMKELSDLFYAAKQMYDWLKEDSLSVEMKDTLFSLIESHTAHAAKILGYDSNSAKEIDARYADIRQANQTIHELEQKLATNTQVDGLKELFREMEYALRGWWHLQGFDHIGDTEFGAFGLKGKFYVLPNRVYTMSQKPVTEKQQQKNKIEQMMEQGYEFVQEPGDDLGLLDTQKNKDLITAAAKSKFKSIDIIKWNNWCLHKKDGFKLWDFEAYIRDYSELKSLMDEMKQVKDVFDY